VYPQTIATHFIRLARQVNRLLVVPSRHVRVGTLGVLLIVAVGCGGGGSGGGEDSSAAIASTPVDLPPGQTTAALAWTPSAGDVSGYYILESRNGSSFSFASFSETAEGEISGTAGDRLRIQVIALSPSGTVSAPSPPSVEIRFHPALEVVSATLTATSAATGAEAPDAIAAATSAIEESGADSESSAEGDRDDDEEAELDATASIDPLLRARLLSADLRFPFERHSQDASQWLQTQVDEQIGAGLSLVGTGEADSDAYRELIWADQSGQLFVSDGAGLAGASTLTDSTDSTDSTATIDPTSTFAEAIRLRATERFVGLADFDGDGVGDWLIEDSATLEIWMVNGETQETIAVLASGQDDNSAQAARLVGLGDFDGDGRSELLWSDGDGSFQIGRPSTSALAPDAGLTGDTWTWLEGADIDLATSQLLTVTDLNEDGRDDLLFVGVDGRLQAAHSVLDAVSGLETDGALFVGSIGSERSTDGLDLIATLDLDGDGRNEIAWHDGVGLALWDAWDTP
jgi:hypothetical protein